MSQKPQTTDSGNNISSLYPDPPIYYKSFSQENIASFSKKYKVDAGTQFTDVYNQIIEKENNLITDNVTYIASNDASTKFYKHTRAILQNEENENMTHLIPPNLPEDDKIEQFSMFGNLWNIKDSLPELGPIQLFPKQEDGRVINKKKELKKLVKSLLLNFLLLITNLSVNSDLQLDPESKENHLEHIRVILMNLHHLLNEYRPHQVKENFILLLEEQISFKKLEIANIIQVISEVKKDLKDLM